MKLLVIFNFGFLSSQLLGSSALDRAQSAAFIPNLRLHYGYERGLSHVVVASLAWDIDEFLSSEKKIAAIQLERLKRETERIKYELQTIDEEL